MKTKEIIKQMMLDKPHLKDNDNNTWCGTLGAGLYKIDGTSNRIVNYNTASIIPSGLKDNYIWSLYIDRSSNIWVGSGSDIYRYDKNSDRFNPLNIKNKDKSFQYLSRSIYEDKQGNLWIGFFNAGLHKYNKDTNTFK